MAYGGNLRGLFWYVCLDKNLKGKSCVFFLPKLNWVCNKLPLTEAVPRKKAGCYLEPKSSWFIQPESFLEIVFPSPLCPGERLQWAARPKDCGTGMLRKPLSSLAVGGLEETTDEDASSRTWVLFLTGHQKHLGIFFFFPPKIQYVGFFPCCLLKPISGPFRPGLCPRMLTSYGGVSRLPGQLNPAWRRHQARDGKAGGIRGLFPMPSLPQFCVSP